MGCSSSSSSSTSGSSSSSSSSTGDHSDSSSSITAGGAGAAGSFLSYRHTVSSDLKMGSDAVCAAHRAVPKGKVGGRKKRKEASVLDASCPTMPK